MAEPARQEGAVVPILLINRTPKCNHLNLLEWMLGIMFL